MIHTKIDNLRSREVYFTNWSQAHEETVKKCALFANTELPAFCALFGGIVALEVVKQAGNEFLIFFYLLKLMFLSSVLCL